MKGRGRTSGVKNKAMAKRWIRVETQDPLKEFLVPLHEIAKPSNQREHQVQVSQVTQVETSETTMPEVPKICAKPIGNPYNVQTFGSVVGNENE